MDPVAVASEPTGKAFSPSESVDSTNAPATNLITRPFDPAAIPAEDPRNLLPRVATKFLGFEIVAELGRGTSGSVFLARQGELADRLVALKVTTDEFDESHALAQLQHTNVVPIHSVHRIGPLCAVCMPYFGNVTLADVLRDLAERSEPPSSGKDLLTTLFHRRETFVLSTRPPESIGDQTRPGRRRPASQPDLAIPVEPPAPKPPPPPAPPRTTGILRMLESVGYEDACLWIASRLADGLSHAHDRGILHLDLKPANVLLTDEGQPMLLDFNMARDTKHRGTGDGVGGTVPYMAPEHLAAFAGETVNLDVRTDVFSLGVILFELLARRRPFPASSGAAEELPALIAARKSGPTALRTHNAAVSAAVEDVVHKCFAPNPADRFQSAQELGDALRRHISQRSPQPAADSLPGGRLRTWAGRHPIWAAWAAATILAATALAGWELGRSQRTISLESPVRADIIIP